MSSRPAPSQDAATLGSFTLTRAFEAPRDLVWRAWTEPERVARWWGPRGFTSRVLDYDPRTGGAIRIDMHAPDGAVYPMSGAFRDLAPPERLSFIGSAVDGEGRPLFEVLHTITLAEDGPVRTILTMQARVLTATAAAAPHLSGAKVGWTQQLERLAAYLTAPAQTGGDATLTVASDREIRATRTFDAPRWLVFRAWTQPDALARCWGPRGFVNTVHAMDVRPGGAWRVTQRAADGSEHHFEGVYREVVAPERLVHTQRYGSEAGSDREVLVAVDLDEQNGRTTLTVTMQFASLAARDGMLGSGMEWGMRQSWERLTEALAATPVGPETPWAGEIVASRIVAAPRDLMWRLWTEPEHVARWWGPHDFRTTIREMEVRPGGPWRFLMHGPDGTDYDSEMVYAEVCRPARLVYQHTMPPVFRQEVAFTDLGDGRTRVAVRSTFDRPEDVQPYAVEGMRQTLERFGQAVAG